MVWFIYEKIHNIYSYICSEEYNTDECSICLEQFGYEHSIHTTKCNHMFHNHCINTWMLTSINCPLCRSQIVQTCELTNGIYPRNQIEINQSEINQHRFILRRRTRSRRTRRGRIDEFIYEIVINDQYRT